MPSVPPIFLCQRLKWPYIALFTFTFSLCLSYSDQSFAVDVIFHSSFPWKDAGFAFVGEKIGMCDKDKIPAIIMQSFWRSSFFARWRSEIWTFWSPNLLSVSSLLKCVFSCDLWMLWRFGKIRGIGSTVWSMNSSQQNVLVYIKSFCRSSIRSSTTRPALLTAFISGTNASVSSLPTRYFAINIMAIIYHYNINDFAVYSV